MPSEILDEIESPSQEAFDQLTIKLNNKGKDVRDVWQRATKRQPPSESDGIVLRFEIPYARIVPTQNETNSNTKKFIAYDISIQQDSAKSPDSNPTTIERRYSHFKRLYDALKKDHPKLMQMAFPKKVLMGNFAADLIAERSSAFESLLDYIVQVNELKDSPHFLEFLQNDELHKACSLLDERRNELSVPLLENCFQIVNKVYLDKSRPVLLLLCRLVAACTTSPLPHPLAEKWCEVALRRYEHVCDTELLLLYIPLLNTVMHLWFQRGRDSTKIRERLDEMGRKGIKIQGVLTLTQAIHALDPKTELV